MAHRELELTLLSARDLKSVNLFTRMDVYAVASISGDPMTRQSTPTDTTGGRNPSWNASLRFNVPPSAAAAGGWLHVLLRSERALGDRDVGEVVVPLAELLASADGPGPQPLRVASYQVHTVLRGEPRGVLNVSYRLGPIVAPVEKADDTPPVYAYPVPQHNFNPQNPYSPPHDAYQQPSPKQNFKLQNPAYQQPQNYQYSPPRDAYQKPPLNPAPQTPYQYSPPHNSYRRPPPPPPRHEGEGNGHGGPNQVYMGPHTQIIFNGGGYPPSPGGSNNTTIPQAKEDNGLTKPKSNYNPPTQPNNTNIPASKEDDGLMKPTKPYYAPTQSKQSSRKTDHNNQNWPNTSLKKPDHSTPTQHEIKVREQVHTTQSETGPVKTDHSTKPQQEDVQQKDLKQVVTRISSSRKTDGTRAGEYGPTQPNNVHNNNAADSTRPKEEKHATNRSNSTPAAKADQEHQSAHKSALQQYERVHSLHTAAAR